MALLRVPTEEAGMLASPKAERLAEVLRLVIAVRMPGDASLWTFDLSLARHERACGSPKADAGESNGEPPRNRTENQQIKSLLLCQLS